MLKKRREVVDCPRELRAAAHSLRREERKDLRAIVDGIVETTATISRTGAWAGKK